MGENYDAAGGHRYFSAFCFNKAWEYLDKGELGASEIEAMIHASHASLWHWLERPEASHEKRSIGYWQLSRVYARAGRGDNSLHYAGLSVEEAESGSLEPFYLGYAFEATSRAYKVLGRHQGQAIWKERAVEELGKIVNEKARQLLEKDLAEL